MSIAIAGAGCALAILGVMIIAGDTGSDGGDFNKWPGVVLSALVVAAGWLVLTAVRSGAVATAGAVAAAVGVPPLMFFLTFSEGSFPPYSTDGILLVSTAVWLGAYAFGPSRGRPFFLGAGLIGLWFTILQLVEGVFESPFEAVTTISTDLSTTTTIGDDYGGFGGSSFDAPDPNTIGALSLALGVMLVVLGRWNDTAGRRGTGTPFALVAPACLTVGVVALAPELDAAGTGLVTMLIGLAMAYHGATVHRRFTTWAGGAATTLGAAIFLIDMTDDALVGGMLFMAAGIALVLAGHAIASAIHEPDEMTVTRATAPAVTRQVVAPSPPSAPPSPTPDDSRWAPPPDPSIPPPPGAPGDDDPPPPPF